MLLDGNEQEEKTVGECSREDAYIHGIFKREQRKGSCRPGVKEKGTGRHIFYVLQTKENGIDGRHLIGRRTLRIGCKGECEDRNWCEFDQCQ